LVQALLRGREVQTSNKKTNDNNHAEYCNMQVSSYPVDFFGDRFLPFVGQRRGGDRFTVNHKSEESGYQKETIDPENSPRHKNDQGERNQKSNEKVAGLPPAKKRKIDLCEITALESQIFPFNLRRFEFNCPACDRKRPLFALSIAHSKRTSAHRAHSGPMRP